MRTHPGALPPCLAWTLSSALFLLGCGDSGSSNMLGDHPTLIGQLQGWSRGDGYTLTASLVPVSSNIPTLAMAPIDTAGNFRITLPGNDALSMYLSAQHVSRDQLSAGCQSSDLQATPADFRSGVLQLNAVGAAGTIGVTQATNSGTKISYLFVDRNLDETGRISCLLPGASLSQSLDLHFVAGWNAQLSTQSGSTYVLTSGNVPADAKWQAP